MGGWIGRWVDGWMDGWVDEWMDRWMHRWAGGWVGGWTSEYIPLLPVVCNDLWGWSALTLSRSRTQAVSFHPGISGTQ